LEDEVALVSGEQVIRATDLVEDAAELRQRELTDLLAVGEREGLFTVGRRRYEHRAYEDRRRAVRAITEADLNLLGVSVCGEFKHFGDRLTWVFEVDEHPLVGLDVTDQLIGVYLCPGILRERPLALGGLKLGCTEDHLCVAHVLIVHAVKEHLVTDGPVQYVWGLGKDRDA